jgi:hypothetical protein
MLYRLLRSREQASAFYCCAEDTGKVMVPIGVPHAPRSGRLPLFLRNVGALWRDTGLFGGFWLLARRWGWGAAVFFCNRCIHVFSFCGSHRDHDMDHSDAPGKQGNSAQGVRSIDGRLSKLERSFGITHTQTFLVVVSDCERRSLANDACLKILEEEGFLHTGGFGIVDLSLIPRGLNAQETEKFLRQNGARIGSVRG